MEIIREALEETGACLEDVIRTRTYLTRADDWQAVGEVHGHFFGEARPVSTMLVVSALLDPEWRVEIEAEAISLTLGLTGYNKSAAARILGISRPTLTRKIRKYGLARSKGQAG